MSSFIVDLNFKLFRIFTRNWTEKDLLLFRKYKINPESRFAFKRLIREIVGFYEDCFNIKREISYCLNDVDVDVKGLGIEYKESHDYYQDHLLMLKILINNNPTAFETERILIGSEYETIAIYTIYIMDMEDVYPPELIEIIFYADNFNPNQITYGKTLLHNLISLSVKWGLKVETLDILLQHPLLDINYTDYRNEHILAFFFKNIQTIRQSTQIIEILLKKREDIRLDVIKTSDFKTWSKKQLKIYNILLKDRDYYRLIQWKKIRLIFIARLKECGNIWSWLPMEIIYLIIFDFGWERVELSKCPRI